MDSIIDQKALAYGYNNHSIKEISLANTIYREYDITRSNEQNNKEILKIMTYNVWMSPNISYSRYKERAPHLINLIKLEDPDIIFLQECSHEFYEVLKKLSYNLSVEPPSDTMVFNVIGSKFPIESEFYGETNGDHVYSFNMAVISGMFCINIYLHAGSSSSPGITNPQKYHDYRRKQLEIIHQKMNEFNNNDFIFQRYKTDEKRLPIILGGDFNMDLDSPSLFPEISVLKSFDLNDTCKDKYFTEDTDINLMRWNVKQISRKFRYDAILVDNNFDSITSKIIGTKPCFMTDEEFERPSFRFHVDRANLDKEKMRLIDGHFPWFPSDHFGVVVKVLKKK